jgi:hypothetical protein
MIQYQLPKGLLFTQLHQEPYTRKDGRLSSVLVWQATCAREGCNTPFTIKTGVNYQNSKSFGNKHCPLHKMTQEEIMKAWRGARKLVRSPGRTKLSNKDVEFIKASPLTPEGLALLFPVSERYIREIKNGVRRKNPLKPFGKITT